MGSSAPIDQNGLCCAASAEPVQMRRCDIEQTLKLFLCRASRSDTLKQHYHASQTPPTSRQLLRCHSSAPVVANSCVPAGRLPTWHIPDPSLAKRLVFAGLGKQSTTCRSSRVLRRGGSAMGRSRLPMGTELALQSPPRARGVWRTPSGSQSRLAGTQWTGITCFLPRRRATPWTTCR